MGASGVMTKSASLPLAIAPLWVDQQGASEPFCLCSAHMDSSLAVKSSDNSGFSLWLWPLFKKGTNCSFYEILSVQSTCVLPVKDVRLHRFLNTSWIILNLKLLLNVRLPSLAVEREELHWVPGAERAGVQQAGQLQELLAESQLSVGPESVRVPRFAWWDRCWSAHTNTQHCGKGFMHSHTNWPLMLCSL